MINLLYSGTWSPYTTYNRGALVKYQTDNDWYICLNNSTTGANKHPHNTLYWSRATSTVAESAEIASDACNTISSAINRKESTEQQALQMVSTTAAGTATKTVNSAPTNLPSGIMVGVMIQNANTASNPKLKLGTETYTIDLGTHAATDIKGYCLFILARMNNNNLVARFLGGSYTYT